MASPWTFQGQAEGSAAKGYWERVNERREREVQTLASLTGWSHAAIRERMGKDAPKANEPRWCGSDGVARRAGAPQVCHRFPWLTTYRRGAGPS
ncbi:hypothetical protein [Pyxidicoccus sp. MSG2]|uniref:hypothetical protein n=1 Tax=Pyxidicoccus sp. MSG2 TaxID=2996790 RepID=UPI00226E9469|nr:hypothetical protein [Pyxidicoccus sp. MSG2]MCY1023092.1 hypothetical protein [Pyxidicoccus sp. MSG2]